MLFVEQLRLHWVSSLDFVTNYAFLCVNIDLAKILVMSASESIFYNTPPLNLGETIDLSPKLVRMFLSSLTSTAGQIKSAISWTRTMIKSGFFSYVIKGQFKIKSPSCMSYYVWYKLRGSFLESEEKNQPGDVYWVKRD